MADTYHNYVDGEWTRSRTGDTFEVRNPADLDDVVGQFQSSSREDAEEAIAAAVAAQDDWAGTPAPERGAVLTRAARNLEARKEELTESLTREEGKTLGEARGEVQRAIDIFYYYAQKAREFRGTVKNSSATHQNLYTVREPLGTVGLITPWNYPIAIPAWKIAPALATGNTIAFKPASNTPDIARELVECIDDAGLPDGVLNYVTGSGSQIGDPFSEHEDIDGVSFTGSSTVGNAVYDAATGDGKRVQTEMGGKNPTVVMPSADIEEAAGHAGLGAFGVTGQACTACSRAIVHESVHDEFVDAIVDYADDIGIGDGREGADMGPHVSQGELEGTLDYIDVGETEGATLTYGGSRLEGGDYDDGYFIEPTVFTDVDSDMRIAQEEIFGPVLAVIGVSDFDEAMEVANDVDYGLSSSIVTQDHTEANRFIDEIEAGVAKVNDKTTGLELHVPFGGFKNSSSETWREQGDAGIDFYTIDKTVYDNY